MYLGKTRRLGAPTGALSTITAQLSGWLIEKKGQPLLVYYGGNAMDISMMLPYLDRFPHAKVLN